MGAIVAEVERLVVRKTYKLYIGGKFPRTESGRSYLVSDSRGRPLANACRGSRKDVRDAVRAARGAFAGWSGLTAYNRGQILYRIAEILEGRRKQFVDEVAAAAGWRRRRPATRSTRRSTAGSGTPAGRTRSRRCWAPPTRSPAPISTSRCRSRPAWSGWSRRPTPRCSAWSRGWRR